MTDTAAQPSLVERAREWIRHEIHAHHGKELVLDLVHEVEGLKGRLAKLEADIAALVAKDGPVVARDAKLVAHDAAPVVKEAADAVVEAEKAAGA